jgi:hypothetical protein
MTEEEFTKAKEHYAWCVSRAEEYLNQGDTTNACASFASDMGKNPITKERLQPFGAILLFEAMAGVEPLRRFIKGFNF